MRITHASHLLLLSSSAANRQVIRLAQVLFILVGTMFDQIDCGVIWRMWDAITFHVSVSYRPSYFHCPIRKLLRKCYAMLCYHAFSQRFAQGLLEWSFPVDRRLAADTVIKEAKQLQWLMATWLVNSTELNSITCLKTLPHITRSRSAHFYFVWKWSDSYYIIVDYINWFSRRRTKKRNEGQQISKRRDYTVPQQWDCNRSTSSKEAVAVTQKEQANEANITSRHVTKSNTKAPRLSYNCLIRRMPLKHSEVETRKALAVSSHHYRTMPSDAYFIGLQGTTTTSAVPLEKTSCIHQVPRWFVFYDSIVAMTRIFIFPPLSYLVQHTDVFSFCGNN